MGKWFKMMMALAIVCLWSGLAMAQNIEVKRVEVSALDYTSSKKDLKDKLGKVCPAIKVQVPGLDNLTFKEAQGEVYFNAGEYTLFVPSDTRQLTIMNGAKQLCTIDFAKWNIASLTPATTYQVIMSVNRQFNLVFQVQPASAKVTVGGHPVVLDKNGVGSFVYSLNQLYQYSVSAPGYKTVEESFMVTPEEDALEPLHIALEQKLAPMQFKGNVKEFELLIDGESWGMVKKGQTVDVPVGSWKFEAKADNYYPWSAPVTVRENSDNQLYVEMNKEKAKTGDLRNRFSIFAGGGVAFPFGDRTNMDKEHAKGFPVRLGIDWEMFVTRWFTLRPGFEYEHFAGPEMKRYPGVSQYPHALNFSVSANLNLPLGKFNRNHFSIGVGPVAGYVFYTKKEDATGTVTSESGEVLDVGEKGELMYGVRADVRFTIQHVIFGFNADYLRSKTIISKDGMITPMLYLGYKF